ncbi:MAG: type II toxin-antitoxin system RelE/ParE family toxin [Deltaproteobacteria bacterium]|nr:type II toxin-antitoxin system RelE/ParE family toxin [Deltaproteobacteria bacterium]MDL1989177.1 type II toxin-antitoxin system RelE/ParE family toxin [Deltaproteobacteria bacterium]
MNPKDKPIVWLKSEIKSPPFSEQARIQAEYLLRLLQQGNKLEMPYSKKIPDLCSRCHELRIKDKDKWYRIIYRIDQDAILLLHAFEKKSNKIPKTIMETCKQRMKWYDNASK